MEHRGPMELPVVGDIPVWAAGSLYRTGPSNCKIEETVKGPYAVHHWFDGFAHTHKFNIAPSDDGKVRVNYSSRRQCDDLVAEIKASGTHNYFSFAQARDPCIGMFGKFMNVFEKPKAIPNVMVTVLNDFKFPSEKPPSGAGLTGTETMWLTTDNHLLQAIDPNTLEPVGLAVQKDLHPSLTGACSCAHAQKDPDTGDVFNFNLDFGRNAVYRVFKVSAKTGETEILATISDPSIKGAYIHSFFLTQNYVVLCVPISHFAHNGLKIVWNRNLLESMEPFDASKNCKWLVIDRRKGRGLIAKFSTPASFFFHSANAFEEAVSGEEAVDIFCDFLLFPNRDILDKLYYNVLLNEDEGFKKFFKTKSDVATWSPHLARYRFRVPTTEKPEGGKASTEALQPPEEVFRIPSPHAGEMPAINPSYACKRHRYVYGACTRGLSVLFDGLTKIDTVTRDCLIWSPPHGHTPGEPIFLPKPQTLGEDLDEDDGVLLSVVLNGTNSKSYLVCIDAKTMKETGRAECAFAIGFGLHGVHAKLA
jgi:torulene dioxygenase